MSRLRELRLHGFKTFADPTRFVFEPGVTAVIGPNGSGKSNMADAVRWVLGEQSNRSLRTRRADDVIFAGSQQRKPQGMAEAILTLDNADGWLPIEFSEVSIGRRAYRSGESEYLINGARARLRDVVELLGEGRLGANELVVVGQGTVDSALSLRPEERRQLFDEAAGVKNLQVRKNEALARLARARDNLTRVTDLMSELKPQVRRLAVQAQHSQEHDSLGRRARALVLEAHRRREAAERAGLGDARRRAAAAEAALAAHRAEEASSRKAISDAEARYWQADAAAQAAAGQREASREAVIRAEGRLEAVARRLAEVESAIADAEAELAETLTGSDAEPGAIDSESTRAVAHAAAAEAAWQAASAALAELDGTVMAAEEALAEARRRAGARIAREARLGELTARADARRDQLATEQEDVRREVAAGGAALEPARTAAILAREAAARGRAEHEEALTAIVAAQPVADAARRRASELAEKAGAMRGELDALQDRAGGAGKLGSILAAAGWSGLLDGLDAPDDAWPAIEAVVGGELEQALLWQDDELSGRLADARGSARIVASPSRMPGHGPSAESRDKALRAVGGTRTLAQWLGGNGAPALFAWTALAPDVDALLAGWRSLPDGWLAVTPNGDLADARGLLVVRGRADPTVSEAARRHGRRRELSQALDALEAEQGQAAAEAARAMAAVSEAARRLEAVRIQREAGEQRERLAAEQLETAEARVRRSKADEQRLMDELSLLAVQPPVDAADIPAPEIPAPQIEGGPPDLAPLDADAGAARERRVAAATARDLARDAWITAQAGARRIEERQLGAQRSRAVREARRIQLDATVAEQRAIGERLMAERMAQQPEVDAARATDEQTASERRAADGERDAARAALVELERKVGHGGAQLAALEREAQDAAVDASRREEALAALSRERELALESLPETEAIDAKEAPADDVALRGELTELDGTGLETELRRVRRTLSQIGSVNPFAVEEHHELATRLDDLATQDADLGRAIASTEELIGRLDGDIGERFNAAFAAIGERFDDFCRLLFAGGSASLQLGDGSDGEPPGGIEIVVRPPGKRLQRLAMLSGGERALTGVALLFAMLSVNPVPFCILDEVDAALDEANISRFADALRRLAEEIDFVVITHNRATIEVADTIYGVTMSDAAVSAIVSLRLADLPVEVSVG
ncbi:MAG: chromosome segregation protein SMC [Chloroflexota bacterium]